MYTQHDNDKNNDDNNDNNDINDHYDTRTSLLILG